MGMPKEIVRYLA